jgi:hypothetical protein
MKLFIRALTSFLFSILLLPGEEVDINLLVKEILAAPDWTRTEEDELKNKRINKMRGAKILAVMSKGVSLSPENARLLVMRLHAQKKKNDRGVDGKIYIFNRFYCNVPEWVDKADWRFFGGWGSIPHDNKTVGALYPLKESKDREVELVYLSGSYTGPAYRGLEEFDFLFKRFGKRKVK